VAWDELGKAFGFDIPVGLGVDEYLGFARRGPAICSSTALETSMVSPPLLAGEILPGVGSLEIYGGRIMTSWRGANDEGVDRRIMDDAPSVVGALYISVPSEPTTVDSVFELLD
jgi:hypothetical protein